MESDEATTEGAKATEPCLNEYVGATTSGCQDDNRAEDDAEDAVCEVCVNKHGWSEEAQTTNHHTERDGAGDVVEGVPVWIP